MPSSTLAALIKRSAAPLLAAAVLASAGIAGAQTTPPGSTSVPPEGRWQTSLAAFAAADREKPPSADGVLFVGSSTIRLWSDIAQDFRQVPVVINRGFGGSTMADCDRFAQQLVTRYKPRHVLVYAGDNDLAEGRSPQQVLSSFTNFVQVVRAELPATRISYISIKPSPLRAALIPRIRETNALLSAYVATLGNAEYIDTFSAMMTPQGDPRAELFGPDKLHMNDAGYDLWQDIIGAHIKAPAAVQARAVAAGVNPAISAARASPAPLAR